MKRIVERVIERCTECPHHRVDPDPDPHDWFCSDDVKLVCSRAARTITRGERPYRLGKVEIPSWCPLRLAPLGRPK